MAYLAQNDPNLLVDINSRKEFNWNRRWDHNTEDSKSGKDHILLPRFTLDDAIDNSEHLQLTSYQNFVDGFMHPDTPYTRLLMKWQTGTGKTVAALSIAMKFIANYSAERKMGTEQIGSVFIIGFSDVIFKNELIRFPEFSFITRKERTRLKRLKRMAESNETHKLAKYHDMLTKIKKRFSNRKGNGYFHFIGYKAFVNRLFVVPKTMQIADLSEPEILLLIAAGTITYNTVLLAKFRNSLIICDEIHNVYNNTEMNNWGVALQAMLHAEPTCRALFLSATPINNNPAEVIDLLNLLSPSTAARLRRDEFFAKNDGTMPKLLPGALERIGKLSRGRVSYVRDVNPKYYPAIHMRGVTIPGIPYLKFIRSPMSEFHYHTYKSVYTGTLSQDGQYLVDFVLPSPFANAQQQLGLYQTSTIKPQLANAPQAWKTKYGLTFRNGRIMGAALERAQLGKYSSKYVRMLDELRNVIANKTGKVFIYHNIVHMSGVLFIEQVLMRNGYLDEFGSANDNTLCMRCGELRKDHPEANDESAEHKFTAARFVMVHSNVDKSQMHLSLSRFNEPRNADGSSYMILIGSKVMKEGHDVKAIQNVFIMGRPDNIPTLLQIRGRAIRKNSHRDLPLSNRNVNILIFTSCLPIRHGAENKRPIRAEEYALSHEEVKYKEKVLSFRLTQQIERVLHENAIDAVINHELINRVSPVPDPLDVLKFEPAVNRQHRQTSVTFDVYYRKREVEYIRYMIKRFFIEYSSVWSHNDLFAIVKADPRQWCNVDASSFTISNFLIAIDQLTWKNDSRFVEPLQVGSQGMIDRLFDSTDKIITLPSGSRNVIVPLADGASQYYILFPLQHNSPANGSVQSHASPEIDIELPYRVSRRNAPQSINMNAFVRTKRVDFDYTDKRRIFRVKFLHTSIDNMENVICEYGAIFHIKFLEECIHYVFAVWTNAEQEVDVDWHEFYFKMLYYYDLLSLVIWAYTAKQRVFEHYKQYCVSVESKDIKLFALAAYDARNVDETLVELKSNTSDGIINLLKESINRTSNAWIPMEFREGFEKTLEDSYAQFRGRHKRKQLPKPSARVLPIGHFIGKFPRLYSPERGWIEDPTYKQLDGTFVENDLIIGFDEQSVTGVHTRFKLRKPAHNIKKFRDNRLIERGTVCKSKSKAQLREIARKIGATVPAKINVEDLCVLIRSKLIRMELKERIKQSDIKYFYFFYEEQTH